MVYISDLNAFVYPSSIFCAPDTAYYTGRSSHISPAFSAVNWVWTLDNMISTSDSNATAYYPDSGTYNTQVIITDNIGCVDTANNTLNVGLTPTIDSITIDTNRICRITGINFNGYGSSFIDFWNWSFNDASFSYSASFAHVFKDTGIVTGLLSVGFRGCIETIELDSYYIFPPIANFSYAIICDSLKVNFLDESIGAHHWHWDFGDTTSLADTSNMPNPSYVYADTGIYFILLTVYNDSTGCVDSFRNSIQIARPIANFSMPDSICTIGSFQPVNLSQSADTYEWTALGSAPFDATLKTPLLEYSSPGIFPLTLTTLTTDGCSDTLVQYIHVAGIDTNIVHSVPICRPTSVTFTDSSTGVLSPIVNWQWSNGSIENNALVQYLLPGEATINLQLTNDWGCTFDLVDSINVGGAFINFTSGRNICLGSSMTAVALTNSSSNQNAFRPFTYIWDFGDGTIDTTFNTIYYHTYTSPGLYDVCLNVIDSVGCVTTFCQSDWVEVHDPTSQFTSDTAFSTCPPLEVNFSNLSLSGRQWLWNFGDGSVSNLENPTHLYSTSGFYDVTLEVTAFPGCSSIDTIQQMIQISGPTGSFASLAQSSCAPYTAVLISAGSNVATYTWLFGNGDTQSNSTNSANATNDTTHYTYTQAGVYVPILILDDGSGCQFTIQQDTIFITAAPTPNFAADSIACQMDSIQYQLLNNISNNVSIEWSFEGGSPSTSTQSNPNIYYPDTGSFDVQLILSKDGCSDTLTRTNFIQIKAAPIAHFGLTMSDSCAPVLVQFSDSSTNTEGNIQSWFWDFGNNQTANSSDTSLFYTQVDTFPIQLIIENNFGCKDTSRQTFSTYPSPYVHVGVYPSVCTGDTLQLQGTATGNFAWSSTAWISNSSLTNPLTVLDSTQSYTLTSSNIFGCTAIDSLVITAIPTSFVDAGNNQNICLGDSISLQATGNVNAYDWGNNSSLSCQYCTAPRAFPNTTTTYYLQPNISSACSNMDSVIIYVKPLPNAQIDADSLLCAGDTLQLNASGGQSYAWIRGLALSDSSLSNPFALPTFPSTYTVVVLDSNACSDSASIFVNINYTNFTPLPDQSICLGDSAILSLLTGLNPIWSGDSLSCLNCLQTFAYPSDSSSYQVAYYDSNNCLIRDILQVQVLDLSQLEVFGSDTICLGDTIQLAVLGNNNAPVQWIPNYALSNNNSPNPLAYPSVDTEYILQIQQGACLANDTVNVYMRPLTEINTTDISYCIGDSAQLIATGNSSNYNWSPNLSLSNSMIQNPIVSTNNTQIYQVVGTGICNADTAYANVQVQPYPSVQLDRSISAILGSTITLNVSSNSATNFDWSPSIDLSCNDCPNPSWVVNQNQTFYVTVTNQFDCPILDSITIRFISDCTPDLVFVPNAFTPDSDGHNDVLYAQSALVQEIENFQIYNRWGTLLFETDNLLEGWDGSFKGKAVTPDVFGYFLIFKCPTTGAEILKKGSITILR